MWWKTGKRLSRSCMEPFNAGFHIRVTCGTWDLRLKIGEPSRKKVEEQYQLYWASKNIEKAYREITQV